MSQHLAGDVRPILIRIPGNNVSTGTRRLATVPYADALHALLGDGPLEAYSRDTKTLIAPHETGASHGFIAAAQAAYAGHYPLVLSPDRIWLLIAQGFARHVNENAEALRSRFVAHQGKTDLVVTRRDFLPGFAGNDWESIFADFSTLIRAHIGPAAHDAIAPTFSTTGIVEKAAFEITLLDALQSYFRYKVLIVCGIPQFYLEGTTEDWKQVRASAAALAPYDLEWWLADLLPVLDEFIKASEGNPNLTFWQAFYREFPQPTCGPFEENAEDDYPLASGGAITGHLLKFFPYLPADDEESDRRWESLLAAQQERIKAFEARLANFSDDEIEQYLEGGGEEWWQARRIPSHAPTNRYGCSRLFFLPPDEVRSFGIPADEFPSALSSAPLTVATANSTYPLQLVAGFVGAAQDPDTLAVRPEIGWAIRPLSTAEPNT